MSIATKEFISEKGVETEATSTSKDSRSIDLAMEELKAIEQFRQDLISGRATGEKTEALPRNMFDSEKGPIEMAVQNELTPEQAALVTPELTELKEAGAAKDVNDRVMGKFTETLEVGNLAAQNFDITAGDMAGKGGFAR